MINRRAEDVLLATDFSVASYYTAVEEIDRATLADFVEKRFRERYLDPVFPKKGRNGFAIMAICCLMIESLETFRNGPRQTKRKKDHQIFADFFGRYPALQNLVPFAGEFYGHVRCGILHYAQTTGSWRIRRDGSALFDSATLTIEAERFHAAIADALSEYCQALRAAPWESALWINFLETLDLMCKNSGVEVPANG